MKSIVADLFRRQGFAGKVVTTRGEAPLDQVGVHLQKVLHLGFIVSAAEVTRISRKDEPAFFPESSTSELARQRSVVKSPYRSEMQERGGRGF